MIRETSTHGTRPAPSTPDTSQTPVYWKPAWKTPSFITRSKWWSWW